MENQRHGVPRIEHLRKVPATVRFLSIEPLLEDLGKLDLDGIGWVIVGGESGAGARPMKRDWVLAIREQCAAANGQFQQRPPDYNPWNLHATSALHSIPSF